MGTISKTFGIFGWNVLVLLLLVGTPLAAHAALVPCGSNDPTQCDWNAVIEIANRILNFLIGLGTAIAAIIIGYGGILMLVHSGNGGKKAEVKKMIWDVVVGFTVMLTAFMIIKLILTTLGVTMRAPGL